MFTNMYPFFWQMARTYDRFLAICIINPVYAFSGDQVNMMTQKNRIHMVFATTNLFSSNI